MPEVTIRSADGGAFQAYLSIPDNARGESAGIIALQQIFGVNPEMRGFTDDFATHGYISICPYLFWRQRPGVQIIPGAEGAFEQAVAFGAASMPTRGSRTSRRRSPFCALTPPATAWSARWVIAWAGFSPISWRCAATPTAMSAISASASSATSPRRRKSR
jgi:dienelactone hydrolase